MFSFSTISKIVLFIRQSVRWFWRYGISLTIFAVFFTAVVPRSTILTTEIWQAIAFDVSPYHFDYIGWEVNAILAKADSLLFGQHPYIDEEAQTELVRAYMADLAQAQQLENEVSAVYSDPNVSNPDVVTEAQRAQRDALRRSLLDRQSTIEAILEGQVATILVEQGFGVAGQLLPPMAMRFTQMPNLLATSPRDRIQLEVSIALNALPVDQRTAIEDQLDETHNISSLIIPLGGIALYPAMISETSSIAFAVETFAHEWLHHYLYFYPLGISYFTGDGLSGQARIINETTADLFGKEVAGLVLARYYPDIPAPRLPTYEAAPPIVTETPAFDFGAEMNETRTQVDALLLAGDVSGAETYMAERRQFFFENGYRIRKINQAFFAFYGGYQAGGGMSGAGGQDPTGPAVIAVRADSQSILAFIATMRGLTSLDELLRLNQ